jgi:TonB family protein
VNEPVDRVLLDRERVDHGFSRSFGISAAVHGTILVLGVLAPLLFPAPPPLQIADAFAVPLPPGGGGKPSAQEAAPAPVQPAPQAPPVTMPAAPPEPQKIIKPPKEEPRQGLPEPDAKPPKKERRPATVPPAGTAPGSAVAETRGLALAVAGPGAPGGTDPNGDYYIAGVSRKVWSIWTQQLHAGNFPTVVVEFTILPDGSLDGLPRIVQPSGMYAIDSAAQRAIATAAPFTRLPNNYGNNALTLRANFKPES